MNEEFFIWVGCLVDEGYDLSDYTWEEMYEEYCYLLDETVLGAAPYKVPKPVQNVMNKVPQGIKNTVRDTANRFMNRMSTRTQTTTSSNAPFRDKPLWTMPGGGHPLDPPATRTPNRPKPSRPQPTSGGSNAPYRDEPLW